VTEESRLVAFEMVEFNPERDEGERTKNLARQIMKRFV